MHVFDFTPLHRCMIGGDRLTGMIEAALRQAEKAENFPPYNIEKLSDDEFRIVIAIAGFSPEDVDVTTDTSSVIIKGSTPADDKQKNYLHKGIGVRSFERVFHLAEHVRVDGATLDNGLLSISLKREVPETLKPRSIEIKSKAA